MLCNMKIYHPHTRLVVQRSSSPDVIKLVVMFVLWGRRRRRPHLVVAERISREPQMAVNRRSKRVCAAHYAPCRLFQILERRRGLAEIIERRTWVSVECRRVIRPGSRVEVSKAKRTARTTRPAAS